MAFVPLNTKTEYSFYSSLIKIDDYLERALELGYRQIGICDENNLFAAYRFIKKAQKKGIQPIVSFESQCLFSNQMIPMSFVALNTEGYQNLLKLSTRKNNEELEWMDLLSGLAVLIPIAYKKNVANLPIKFYFIVDESNLQVEDENIIAFPAFRYLNAADEKVLEVLQKIKVKDLKNQRVRQEQLRSPEVYEEFYQSHCPQALLNLEELVEEIHYHLEENLKLPVFDPTQKAEKLLKIKVQKGLRVKGLEQDLLYQKRLEHELQVIHQMSFDDYFLIVADLLEFAAKNQIYCGMGRGSAVGSLVAYALGITHMDPIKYNFLFERFLNPERVAMPDIDIDMPDNRRAELLMYMQEKYGENHVAQVLTFSTIGKIQALQEVGKLFSLSKLEIEVVTKKLKSNRTLEEEYEKNQQFRVEILRSDLWQTIFEFAKKIETLPNHTSIHASAIILAEKELLCYSALKKGEVLSITQFQASDIEEMGLLKIDFLGLKYLSLLASVRQRVKEKKGIDINPIEIDLNDSKSLELFKKGNTEGIFQYREKESKKLLQKLKVENFEDIAVARAIRNPGSYKFSDEFIERRHKKKPIEIIDDSIKDILLPTYGIMIYQEQVMQVAQKYANFTLGKADLLRRAISKRKGLEEFEKLREEFLMGALSQGHQEDKALSIYDNIMKFANFGFNRSHAYAYAALAFQLAYFKSHYPDEFYEVYLKEYTLTYILEDLKLNLYHFNKLDINMSPLEDQVLEGKVNLSLSRIKGIPKVFVEWIVQNRPFTDWFDFIKKLPKKWCQAKFIRPLIEVGSFDKFEKNRGKLLSNLSDFINYLEIFQIDSSEADLMFNFQDYKDLTATEKYNLENQILGIPLSPHPLILWKERLVNQYSSISKLALYQSSYILVEILKINIIKDKNERYMAFVEVTDLESKQDIVFFSEAYLEGKSELYIKNYCLIKVTVSMRNKERQLKATQIISLEEETEKLWISNSQSEKNKDIMEILLEYPGPCPVILHNEKTKQTQQTTFYVNKSEQLLQKLEKLSIKLVFH
ncbi:MAG: DNA polymerase III subunit alpha [Lactovum sp.]